MKPTPDDFDRRLREALRPAPELRFSPGFDAALRRRLEARRRPRPAGRRLAAVLLAAYATVGALLSVWILAGVEWPAATAPGVWAWLLAAALLSPLLLHRANPLAPPGPGVG